MFLFFKDEKFKLNEKFDKFLVKILNKIRILILRELRKSIKVNNNRVLQGINNRILFFKTGHGPVHGYVMIIDH